MENYFSDAFIAGFCKAFQSLQGNLSMDIVVEWAKGQSDDVLRCDHEDSILQESIPIVLLNIARVEKLFILV